MSQREQKNRNERRQGLSLGAFAAKRVGYRKAAQALLFPVMYIYAQGYWGKPEVAMGEYIAASDTSQPTAYRDRQRFRDAFEPELPLDAVVDHLERTKPETVAALRAYGAKIRKLDQVANEDDVMAEYGAELGLA